MASDRARADGQSSPSNEQQDGVRTGGNLPASGVVHVGEASRDEEFVDSVNVGTREFCSIKQAVPKFCGEQESFPIWSKRFRPRLRWGFTFGRRFFQWLGVTRSE